MDSNSADVSENSSGNCCCCTLVICVVVVAVLAFVFRKQIRIVKRLLGISGGPPAATKCEPNTVVLHQYPRGAKIIPSASPFCLKLETYLRLAGIKYINVFGRDMSAKGKMPWIEYNGEFVADSQFCIDFLKKKLDINLNKDLTPEQQAVSHALCKMIEENTLWYIALERWYYKSCPGFLKASKLPGPILWYISRESNRRAVGHGIGKHTHEELIQIMEKDLTAVSLYLGNKKFMMGDEPSEIDCTMFGFLAQFKYTFPDDVAARKLMNEKLPNLNEYCERVKEKYWVDWDELQQK